MSRTNSLGGIFLLAALVATTANAQPPADKRAGVKAILAAWEARRAQFPYLRYIAKGEQTIPKGISTLSASDKPLAVPLPTQDKTFPVKLSLLLDTKRDRYRLEHHSFDYDFERDTARQYSLVSGFDGEQKWTSIPTGGTRPPGGEDLDAAIVSGNLRNITFHPEVLMPFLGHGYVMLHHHRLYPGRFQPKLDPDEFYIHGKTKYEGVLCTLVRTELDHQGMDTFDEFWVDEGRGGLILRNLHYRGKEISRETDLRYRKQGDDWVLAGWTFRSRGAGKTMQVLRFQVESCETAPQVDETAFALALSPGMKVRRTVYGGNPESAAMASLETERNYVVDSWGRLVPTDGLHPNLSSWFWIIFGGVILILIGGIGLWWYRRRIRVFA
jgi:hypothetical protein